MYSAFVVRGGRGVSKHNPYPGALGGEMPSAARRHRACPAGEAHPPGAGGSHPLGGREGPTISRCTASPCPESCSPAHEPGSRRPVPRRTGRSEGAGGGASGRSWSHGLAPGWDVLTTELRPRASPPPSVSCHQGTPLTTGPSAVRAAGSLARMEMPLKLKTKTIND